MRTTIALDDGIVEKLRRLARKRGISFRQAVEETLRRGLSRQAPKRGRPKPYRVDPFRTEFRAGVDPMHLNQLADELAATDG